MAMEKRARFQSSWLPYALILPQIAVTLVFFVWPAGQAVYQSVYIQDAFGGNLQFVGLDNFRDLWNDEHYLASFRVTAVFSSLVAFFGLSISLVLAVFADRIVRGATAYKTLLIWPYAVAPAIAGGALGIPVQSVDRHRRLLAEAGGRRLEFRAEQRAGDGAGRRRRGVEAGQLQLSLLPGGTAVDSEVAARSGSDRRRGPGEAVRHHHVSRCCRRRRSSCVVINFVYAFIDTFGIIDTATSGGPGQATEILVYKLYKDGFKSLDLGSSGAQSVILIVILITLTVFQFRFVEKKVHY